MDCIRVRTRRWFKKFQIMEDRHHAATAHIGQHPTHAMRPEFHFLFLPAKNGGVDFFQMLRNIVNDIAEDRDEVDPSHAEE